MPNWKQLTTYALVAAVAGAAGYGISQWAGIGARPAAGSGPVVEHGVEGKAAADFTLPDLAGKPHSLAQYRGKWLLVNFWASWCAPCMEEIPLLVQAQEDYQQHNFQVLGVAMDDPDAVRKTMQEQGFNYPSLIGDEAVINAMDALGNHLGALPYTVLIDPAGIVRQAELGGLDAPKLQAWLRDSLPITQN